MKKTKEEKIEYWCNRIDNLIMQANKTNSEYMRLNIMRVVSSYTPYYVKKNASFQIVCTQLVPVTYQSGMCNDLKEFLNVPITRKTRKYIRIIFLSPELSKTF